MFLAGCAHQPAMGGSEGDAYLGSPDQNTVARYSQPEMSAAEQSDRTTERYPELLSDPGPF